VAHITLSEQTHIFPRSISTDHQLLSDLTEMFTTVQIKLGKEINKGLRAKRPEAKELTKMKRSTYTKYHLYIYDLTTNVWEPTQQLLQQSISEDLHDKVPQPLLLDITSRICVISKALNRLQQDMKKEIYEHNKVFRQQLEATRKVPPDQLNK